MSADGWCPRCAPYLGGDLPLIYCEAHMLPDGGEQDATAREALGPAGYMVEAGGEDNRAFCEWLHRIRPQEVKA